MIVAALVMMALCRLRPARQRSRARWWMPRAGPRPASRCCSQSWGCGLGTTGALAGEVRSGRAVPDRRSPGKGSPGPFSPGALGLCPEGGLAGQAFSPSVLPAAGSVQLKLGGPVHTAVRVVGPDGKPVAGARVAPVRLRVAGGIRPRSTFPPPDSLADLLAATTDADGKGQIKGCRAEDIEAVRVEAAGFGRQGSELGAAAGGARVDHAEARRPADRPRSGRRSVRGAGAGGHRPDAAAGIGRPANVGRGPRDDRCRGPLRDPGPRRRQARAQRASRRGLEASTQASRRPHDRAGQDHRGHDPAGGPPARADGGGPRGRPRRPARRRRHRVPVRRFPGADRSRDRRGWAIPIERRRRAADVPVRPQSRVTASAAWPSHPSQTT